MSVTLADIAGRVGVSTATVSLVLSERYKGRVTEARAEEIRAAATEMKYVGNGIAGALRTRKSNTIALVSDVVASTPYAYAMVAAANKTANDNDYMLLIAETGGDPVQTKQTFTTLLSKQITTLAYASMHHHEVALPDIRPENIMILDGYSKEPGVVSVVPDEAQGAYAAVRHLIELGHREIAFLNISTSKDAGPLRAFGYKKALADAGIQFNPKLLWECEAGPANVDAAALKLLSSEVRPTAVFCFNDETAAGVYRCAAKLGIQIPTDLSVVGFDNFEPIAINLDPPLTTMQLPHSQMAEWVISTLIGINEKRAGMPKKPLVKFPCPLVLRASTSTPPNAERKSP